MMRLNPRSLFQQRGFTLMELLIGVSILAILLSVAVPSFSQMMRRNRLATAVNELVTALNLGRSEAYKRGLPVSVCATDSSQASCPSTPNWANGWIVFVDTNGDGLRTSTETIIQNYSAVNNISVTTASAAVTFNPVGVSSATSLVVKPTSCVAAAPEKRTITIATTGRIGLDKGNCP